MVLLCCILQLIVHTFTNSQDKEVPRHECASCPYLVILSKRYFLKVSCCTNMANIRPVNNFATFDM